jgi:hypothetical protein
MQSFSPQLQNPIKKAPNGAPEWGSYPGMRVGVGVAGIVDIGRGLERYGLRVREHSAFGGVTPGAHSASGYHPHDEAIDVTDWRADNGPEYEGGQSYSWQERTRRLKERARQLGGFNEVLGPGDEGHSEHLHLAVKGNLQDWNDQKMEWLATGRYRKSDGSYGLELPVAAPVSSGAAAAPSTTSAAAAQRTEVDWRSAASAADRSVNTTETAYWERPDIKAWSQANPQLAAVAMAKAGQWKQQQGGGQ